MSPRGGGQKSDRLFGRIFFRRRNNGGTAGGAFSIGALRGGAPSPKKDFKDFDFNLLTFKDLKALGFSWQKE
jgi:hypothetical protein